MKHTISQLQFILDSAGLNTKVMGSRTGVHEYPALIVRDNFSFRHAYAELTEDLQNFLDGEHKALTVDYEELPRLEDVHLMCSTIAFYTEPPTTVDFVKAVRTLYNDGDFGQQKQIKVIISFPYEAEGF